jgi:hypothetical protein
MIKTFDYYRSTNNRINVIKDQDDEYKKYLKRIDEIV